MSELVIRHAARSDAAALADIYNHYIENSTATFDEVTKTEVERSAWLDAHGPGHPVLIAERDGLVLGWGSLSQYRERPAWRFTAEVGVYVRAGATGAGVGPALLDRLLAEGAEAGHHVLVAQVVSDNAPSLKMFERAGFERVGHLSEVGRKFDRWIDVDILEMRLGTRELR